nr:hypothetical protein [Candidatus Acidoferrales bacterium]
MFLVDVTADKFDNGNMMSWLAPNAGGVAEDKSQGGLKHRFVGLLKAGFLVKHENLARGREFPFGALKEALDL